MNIVLRPSATALVVSFIALGGPIILGAVQMQSLLVAILALLGAAAAVAALYYQLSARITLADGKILIKTLSCRFEDSIENISDKPTKKFNFTEDGELGLKRRILGSRINRFHVGWFTLKNNSVGFVCVTRKARARAIYVGDNCFLLLDPSVAKQITSYVSSHRIRQVEPESQINRPQIDGEVGDN